MYDFIDQKKAVYITFAVILLICAAVVPAAVFFPLKAMFLIAPAALEIGTSYISLFTGGIGLALIAAGLIALAVFEVRTKRYLVSGLLFLTGALGIAFSLTDYYYMTDEEFTYNAPFSFSENSYGWDDFVRIEERIGKKDNTNSIESVSLQLKNGDIIELSSGNILKMSASLAGYIEKAGGEYERIDAN